MRRIGKQLLEALQHLRDQGFVHRDVKPGNIMSFWEGKIQLGDFGTAGKHMGKQYGPDPGTYVYMAPELFVKDCTGLAFYDHKVFLPSQKDLLLCRLLLNPILILLMLHARIALLSHLPYVPAVAC